MPLLNGTQVSPLPLPRSLSKLSLDSEVWSIHQTGEVFLDYESYANRYIFYTQPIFTPSTSPETVYSKPPPSSSPSTSSPQPSTSTTASLKMSFFQAIDYENQHLDRLIYSYFPHSLKRRVLIALLDPLIQSEHSIDSLVSHLYKIYHNRFDTNEKVIVDLSFNRPPSASSTVYYAKILKVFPPKPVRDLGKSNYHDLIHLQTMERFKVDLRQALEWDDSKSYLYTIQLIDDHRSRENGEDDQEDHFEASYMEVEPRKLSRHPNTFSKSLLKKFIQSLLLPYSANRHSSPKWRVAAHVLAHYRIVDPHNNSHLPVSPSHDPSIHPQKRVKKNQHASTLKPEPTVLPAKKKVKIHTVTHNHKPPPPSSMLIPPPSYQDYLYHSPDSSIPQFSENPQQHHLKNHVHPFLPPEIQSYPHLIEAKTVDKGLKRKKKKKKRSDLLEPIIISANPKEIYPSVQYPLPVKELASLKPVEVLPAITPPIKEAKKYIKYPIEDLELDPLTIIDGRHLRKIGPMSPTSLLPLKPKVSQNAGKKMGRALRIWSFFNIFKFNENGLGLRFDEFECKLDQIIGRLIRALLEESHLRYPNTRHGKGRNFSSMSILPYFSNWPHQETEVMTIEEREYWVRKGIRIINLWKKKADAIAANAGGGLGANVGSESTVIGQKKNINKSSEEDLVINLLDVVCQRGGIERVGCLGRLMKYFFSAEGVYLKIDHDLVDEFQSNVTGLVNNEVEKDDLRNSSRGNIKSATPLNLPEGDLESSDLSDPGSVLGPESESEESEAESGYETPREEQRSFGKSNQRIQLSKMRKILRTRFEQMDYGDKLMLAEFLSDLLMESDHVRNYLEHSDEMLTIVRKEKADVNKEKRRVMEELSKCEPKKDKNSEIGHKTPNGLASEFSPPICPTPQAMSSAGQICSDPPQFFTSTGPKNLQPQTDMSVGAESERGEKFEVPLQSAGSEKQIEAPPSPAQLLRQASSASSQLPSPNISINLSGSGTPSQDQFPRLKPITGTILTAKAYSTRVSALTSRQLKSPPVPNWAMEGGYLTEREKLEHQLYEIVLRELELNERFRQYAGVSKTRMLGYDRFYCRYWWFDGIGGMNFYSNDQEQINDGEGEECAGGSSLRSYSGGIFVCGPSIEDLTRIEGLYGGKLALWKRRLKEEYGVEENEDEAEVKKWVLSVDEWGIYDQEEQIEGLMSWLNSKGNREMNLKQNLKDWKEYILDGIRGCKRDRQEEHDGSRLSSSSNQDGKNI